MKKRARIILVIGVGLGAGLLAALPVRAGGPVPGAHKRMPDLTVELTLKTTKYTNPHGIICYSTTPVFTVTNKGRAAAKNFRIREEWMPQGKPWQLFGYSGSMFLGPHRNITEDLGPVAENVWCADKQGKVGFRVIVDDRYEVAESNEGNNVATKIFPWFHVKKKP